MRFTSVKLRLAIWIMGVQTFVLLALGFTLQYVVHVNLLASVDREMTDRLRVHPPVNNWPGLNGSLPNMPPPPAALQRSRPRLFDLQGRGVGPSPRLGLWDAHSFEASKRGRKVYSTITNDHEEFRVLSMPVRQDTKILGVVQTAHSLTEMNRDLRGLLQALLMLIPLSLIVTGISSAFLMGRIIRPMRDIRRTAESIGAEDLSRRLPVIGNDEFSRLSVTFNDMLSRLERGFDQQRRFTADASHELKTPLTVIKANTSLALTGKKTPAQYESSLQAVDRAANLMSSIIQDLLLLARSDAGQLKFDRQPVSIGVVLHSALEQVAESGQAAVEFAGVDSGLSVLGDAPQLIRLFSNLLDNARRHTSADGIIRVKASGNGEQVTIEVRDTGEGIPAEHLPHLCERFYRVDAARTRKGGGTGLGLSISQSIVAGHEGQFHIDSIYGEGTTARVILPQAGLDERISG